MIYILQVIILGLCLGLVYALMATGLTLIFGVMRIVNLAHPIFILCGAYVAELVDTLTYISEWPFSNRTKLRCPLYKFLEELLCVPIGGAASSMRA